MSKTAGRPATHPLARKGYAAPASAAARRPVKISPEGVVRAIVAVTGVVDSVNDLIVPGAFTWTLTQRRPKVVDDHEWGRKAGRVLHVEEWLPGDTRLPETTKDGSPWPAAAGALVATMQYNLNSEAGRESYEWVRFYAETNEAEFSIGYNVPDGKARLRRDGVRVILQVNLFEFSHVLFGAAPLSMALEVKGMHGGSAGCVSEPGLGRARKVHDDIEEDDITPAPADDAPWDEDETPKAHLETKTAAGVVLEAKSLNTEPGPTLDPTDDEEATVVPIETKNANMKGSYEERRCLIDHAVSDLLRGSFMTDLNWACVVATYDTEVVVTAYAKTPSAEPVSYLVPYTYDPDTGAVELGEPARVELSLVAAPAKAPEDHTAADIVTIEQGTSDVESTTVLDPVLASMAPAVMLAQLESKAGRAARAHILAVAAHLETKSAAPAPMSLEDEAAALDAQADPIDTTPVAESGTPSNAPEFTADNLPSDGWAEYRKTEPIKAKRIEGPFKVKTREGVVETADGWLAVDSAGFPYPIAAEEFDQVYAPAADDESAGGGQGDAGEGADAVVSTLEDADDLDENQTVTIDPDDHFATLDDLDDLDDYADTDEAA